MIDLELWKKRKKELKLTFESLSSQTGICISTLKDIFGGKTYAPRIDTVQAIEKALGIIDEEYEQKGRNFYNINLTGDETDVLFKYREVEKVMGEKGKSLVIDFCNSLIDAFKKNPL